MQKKQSKSPEHWAMDVFGDVITKGNIDIVKNLWHLFIKLNAATALVFFRYRTGTRFISSATVFWGYMLMSFCWMAETAMRTDVILSTGKAPAEKSSMLIFWIAMIAFGVIGTYRMYESRKNLRRSDGKSKPRYSADGGLSYLWIPFRKIAEPFGLIALNGNSQYWWQFNEYSFQKYIEPLIILLIGLAFRSFGYGMFGGFVVLCGFSCFMLIVHLEDNYFEMKQETWDAEVLSNVVQHRDEPIQRTEGAVIQQAIIRSDRDFETWQKSAKRESYFEQREAIVDVQPA